MYRISIYIIATLLLVSCNKDNRITLSPDITGQTITATTAGVIGTKITFDDQGTDGVKQYWATGDKIAFYDEDGKYAATFILSSGAGQSSGEFSLVANETALVNGKSYTAVYPTLGDATANPPIPIPSTLTNRAHIISGGTQNGNNSMSHINAQCYMNATYTHGDNSTLSVNFDLEYVMMTIVIGTPSGYEATTHGAPINLTFFNGSRSTSLNLSNITNCNSTITAYMLVEPYAVQGGDSHTLRFDLICKNGYLFQKEVSSNKSYEAGKRYTASLTDENKLTVVTKRYTLITLPASLAGISTLVITDDITASTDLSALKAKLTELAASNPSAGISLVMPNAKGIRAGSFSPTNGALSGCTALTSISLPAATEIGALAFYGCTALTNINLPAATSIGNYALYGCTTLTDISLPAATSIGEYAFSDCNTLANISLPAATSIGNYAFGQCHALTNISLPAATEIGDKVFWNCNTLTNISLPAATEIGDHVFSYCTSITNLEIATSSTGLTSLGSNPFNQGSPTNNIDLIVGEGEAANVDYYISWRNMVFKSIKVI